MTYYYLAADGSTGGPETLEALTGMVAGGTVSLAALVVPAGGEDWTPLARVLRYFYSDASGATAGPVAFSELQRLNQTGVLDQGSWVLEEGAEQWKALEAVIAAGGVEFFVPVAPAAADAAPRTVTAPYRPSGGRTQGIPGNDLYGAPRSSGGQRVVVRHRAALGGMERGPFFLIYLLLVVIDLAVIIGFVKSKFSEPFVDLAEFGEVVKQYFVLLTVLYFVTLAITSFLTFLRLRNIGWPVALLVIHLALFLAAFLPAGMRQSSGGNMLILGFAFGDAVVLALLLIMPPGFARHRRLDSAARMNAVLIPIVTAGLIYGGFAYSKHLEQQRRESKEKELKNPSSAKS